MFNVFVNLKYIVFYEWMLFNVDGIVIVGIIDYVQEVFGDFVFVELLEVGVYFEVEKEIVVVEFVKVVVDVYVLFVGMVSEVNQVVVDVLELVNQDVYVVWLFKMMLDNVVDFDKMFDVVVYQGMVDVV